MAMTDAASVQPMLRARTGLSPIMIGRRGALDRLQGLLEAAEVAVGTRAQDGPAIALVSGEAGIGKSRLLRELIDGLDDSVTVLAAQAQPGSMGRPFDVLGQLAEGSGEPDGGGGDIATEVRRRVADAVARGRTLLIVEDLHWADADSVHLLDQLCSQPWPQLVLVGTYRGTDLSRKAPGGELVLRLERQHSVEQLRLDRLDRVEVAAMLGAIGGDAPSSGAVEAVFRRSGGIPFVVEELVRCCGPDACTDDLKTATLPWSLDEAVRQQLGGLSADERKVADSLAVFGDAAPFDLLGAIGELDDTRLLGALRSLVTQGIVIEPSDDRFWFAHALVADAVHQQLLGRERRRLHERCLTALRGSPAPDHAALARHAVGAGQFELVPPIAREGARRYLDRGASFQALRLASEGLAEAPTDPELLAVATDAAWRLEYGDEALSFARAWLDHAVTDLDRIEAMRFTARLHHELGHGERRDVVLEQLEDLAEQLPPGTARGRAAGAVAQVHMLANRNTQALSWADRAFDDARRHGDQWLEAQATVERASAMVGHDSRATAEAALLHAHEAARRVGDGVLECRVLNNLLGVVSQRSATAQWARSELRSAAARSGLDKLGGAGMIAAWDAEAAMAVADMRAMRQAVSESRALPHAGSFEACASYLHLGLLKIEEGVVSGALEAFARARELDDDKPLPLEVLAYSVGGRRGDMERSFDRYLSTEPPSDSSSSVFVMTEVGLAALMAGLTPARVRDDFLGTWLHEHAGQHWVARHLEGPLRLAEGDATGAVEALLAVLTDPDPTLYATTQAALQISLAAALLASGDREGSLAAVRVALVQLERWPGWRRDRAESLLRRLEGSGRSDGELTAREREVAALIAEGLTNGQLAERLFISPKTAAVHVSNILTKLGLSSRVEVAAWAIRHGVVLQPG